ncbi:hypothetical protein [Arthrobacter sp. H35-D1]|uniref:hypothetical protein n=1 Tax=Arthrobacter sp. H35-D1 TaxID=3046202 RepID=UPI0024B8DF1A|nr:hypothetical protein [Arthrobacter sp. H35-D1]MDJ0315016.1 hypothetical protein [Arthrobacter sp. H35-D1]
MFTHRWRPAVVALVLLGAGFLPLVAAVPASADLSASLDALTLPAVVTSHTPQTTTGRIVLTATDTSTYTPPDPPATEGVGSGVGWHVTEQASELVYSGPNLGTNIPAANLAIVSVDTPTMVSGQPVDPVNGPMVPATSPAGPLDSPRMVLHANSGYGAGTYAQGIELSLTIPGDTRAGTYTSTITTTIGVGP